MLACYRRHPRNGVMYYTRHEALEYSTHVWTATTERPSTPQFKALRSSCHSSCLIASFCSPLPLLCSFHCILPVLTAPTKMPIGTDMYINLPTHCRGQLLRNQTFYSFIQNHPCAYRPLDLTFSSFSLSLSTFPLGRHLFLLQLPYIQLGTPE